VKIRTWESDCVNRLYNGDELRLAIAKETDAAAWAEEMAALLESHDYANLDVAGLAEELRDLSRSRFDELRSRLRVLIVHLLKWQYQPARRSRSWRSTITTQRFDIADMLKESPSLGTRLQPEFAEVWYRATVQAADETGIDIEKFPADCIWDLKTEILLSGWFPS
jgi:hypothetical protein